MKKYQNIVYSTDENLIVETHKEKKDVEDYPEPEDQKLRLHLQRLPGNRITTIVKGFKGSESMYKELSKYLKKNCGVGGSIKEENIIIQGNCRDKIMKLLIERGFKVKVSGG
jgi:Translation initiation factor 1 (eIF-1/SUI1) and related proteins